MLQRYNSFKILQSLLQVGVFVLLTTALKAQIIPNTAVQSPAATGTISAYLPSDYLTGITVNYIKTWQPKQPFTIESDVIATNRNIAEVSKTTQYFDGLGRPLQTVNWQASPGNKDIIAPVVYDAFGREQYKFLPYASDNNTGSFVMNPFSSQKTFYSSTYLSEQPALKNEQYYYSQTYFEPSPLNRVSTTFAPGNAWVGSKGAATERSVKMQYLVNTASDDVRIWDIGFDPLIANNTNKPTNNTNDVSYDPGTLYKTVIIDEKNDAVVEYKDKEGHVILKKVEVGTVAADYSGYDGFLSTYYIYDDLGQLRCVIQPRAVALMITNSINNNTLNWIPTQTYLDELCFRYEYDERQRMIAKKVPGADWVYMVYDQRDRLVFTQDGNMRTKSPQQWMYTLYDDLNRPQQTGIMTYTDTWTNLQAYVDGVTSGNSPIASSGTYVAVNPADLYINNRDYGRPSYQATNSIVFDDGFTSEDNANFTAEIVTATTTTFSNPTSVSLYPIPASGAALYALTYTFYDDYSWTAKTYSTSNTNKLDGGANTAATLENLPAQNSIHTEGMVTGTRVRVIEDPNNLSAGRWIETATFYDEKGRPVQVNSDNYKGGQDVLTSKYNFSGAVVCTYLVHNNASGGVSNFRVKTNMDHDAMGRLLKVTKKLNDDNATARTIIQNQYDALGQLKNKKTGQKSASDTNPLEDDSYSYNIRGWLKGINWYSGTGTYASQVSSTVSKWFGMDLSYSWGFKNGTAQFNGNIYGIKWESAGDETERAYGFKYDAANRLLKADFTQNNGGWTTDAIVDFSMYLGSATNNANAYDENGNIKSMFQTGVKGVQKITIDDLTYTYYNSASNKLSKVTEDAATATDTKLGDFTDKNTANFDYGYDANGNMVVDMNKKMNGTATAAKLMADGTGAITYNHLNLPWSIVVKNDDNTDKGSIVYIYDALGNKLEKRTNELASTYNNNTAKQTTTAYIGSFVYENNKLQFFGHEEGRIRHKQTIDQTTNQPKTEYVYDYFLKDHLGNVRMVLSDEQQSDMYPPLTFEDTDKDKEDAIWDNSSGQTIDITNNRTARIGALSNFGTPAVNKNYVSKPLSKNTGAIGATKMLKVMSGDRIDVSIDYYYAANMASTTPNGTNTLLNSIVAMLNGSEAVSQAIKNDAGTIYTTLTNNPDVSGGTSFFTPENISSGVGTPKSYLHVLLFDERFVFDKTNSFVKQVGGIGYTAGTRGNITQVDEANGIKVRKNGYAYIYFSNESDGQVYFDNFMLTHVRGPLLEETHYYPFGLTMVGISSRAASITPNKEKTFQGQRFDDDLGLNWVQFKWRNHDPQIGRFIEIDPLAAKYVYNSTYAFSENKVTGHVELEGLESVNTNDIKNPTIRAALKDNVVQAANKMNQNLSGAAKVKVSIGVGVSGTVKVGKFVDLKGNANIVNAEASVTSGGKVEAKGSVVSASVSVVTSSKLSKEANGKYEYGVSAATVEYKDGSVTSDIMSGGYNSPSVYKEAKDTDMNASGKVAANTDGDVTLGGQLGIIGGEIKVNLVKAGNATVNAFEAFGNWLCNKVTEIADKTFNMKPNQ